MQKYGFTFRAASGTPKFELPRQPAVPMTLEFGIGATVDAPQGQAPNQSSQVSRL